MTFFDKVRVLIFAHQSRVRSMFLEFLESVEGGPLVNIFLRVYFDDFEKVCVLIYAHQNRVCSMFMVFLEIVEGGGTPVKRIPEGLF